jgi:hypothetical protein
VECLVLQPGSQGENHVHSWTSGGGAIGVTSFLEASCSQTRHSLRQCCWWLLGGVSCAQRPEVVPCSCRRGGAEEPWVLDVLSRRASCSGDLGFGWRRWCCSNDFRYLSLWQWSERQWMRRGPTQSGQRSVIFIGAVRRVFC